MECTDVLSSANSIAGDAYVKKLPDTLHSGRFHDDTFESSVKGNLDCKRSAEEHLARVVERYVFEKNISRTSEEFFVLN